MAKAFLAFADLAAICCFHVSANVFSAAVHPYNRIMQGLATGFVPDNTGFTLVCDAKSFDV